MLNVQHVWVANDVVQTAAFVGFFLVTSVRLYISVHLCAIGVSTVHAQCAVCCVLCAVQCAVYPTAPGVSGVQCAVCHVQCSVPLV